MVTVICPVRAPAGTATVIEVAETVVGVAVAPLKFTLVAPVKLIPVMVTVAPVAAAAGVKDVMDGSPKKVLMEDPVPDGEVTEMTPDVSPF